MKERWRFILIIMITAGAFVGFYYIFTPEIEREDAELLWQGEITAKNSQIEVDHEVYYLEINGTTWKSLGNNEILYEKYEIGVYVYYIYSEGGYNLVLEIV